MARNTKLFTVPAGTGRDDGKTFLLTEMAAVPAEKWAMRALSAIARSGRNEMPDDIKAGGVAGLVKIGMFAITTLDFADAEPLLDEMMTCVAFVPDRAQIDTFTEKPITRPVMWEVDVEDVATILLLRSEVIELHVGFSIAAFLSKLGATAKAAMAASPDTSTSPNQSETASPPA